MLVGVNKRSEVNTHVVGRCVGSGILHLDVSVRDQRLLCAWTARSRGRVVDGGKKRCVKTVRLCSLGHKLQFLLHSSLRTSVIHLCCVDGLPEDNSEKMIRLAFLSVDKKRGARVEGNKR
jgi:hypothetical protein